ncbi:MAG: TRAP transporter large permease [Clostridia bacterium]|nr:TRAP transporter large permease [Clostridia bacterium]MBQ3270921.1 TRAP transporter large permease [Clostridia bacterium]
MVGVLFISFLVCLAVGVPVAFSLGIASCLYFLGSGMPIVQFAQRFFAGMDSFTLLCIPGFTLAGNLMNQGGISDKLLGFADALVGHLRGGLAYANILASMVFAGISGTALADTVALGGIEIPMMVQQGYDTPFSVAVTASSSCMGPIIPPSVPMIIAATMTGLSVSKMFMAGIFPGILMGVSMCLVCYLEAKKKKYPKRDKMLSFKEILKAGREAIWAIIMTAIILFGIMGGVMTPTEASIVCVAYGTIVSFFIYRKLNLKSFYACLKQTLSSAAAIMALVAFANVFAYIMTKERIPNMIADAMLTLTTNKFLILLLINLFLIFVGMFMETIAAILILFPVLLQVATQVGVNPIQFGLICVMNLVIGLTTPPVGVCLFAATAIGGNKLSENVKALVPFMIALFTVLLLVTYVPAVSVGVLQLFTGSAL